MAALALTVLALDGHACGCSKPRTPEDVNSYAHIFEGQVRSVTESSALGFRQQTVVFKVRRHLAGPTDDAITVEFGGSTSCDLERPDFHVGQVYLISDHPIYLAKDNIGIKDPDQLVPSGRYHSNYCSLRERLPAPDAQQADPSTAPATRSLPAAQ